MANFSEINAALLLGLVSSGLRTLSGAKGILGSGVARVVAMQQPLTVASLPSVLVDIDVSSVKIVAPRAKEFQSLSVSESSQTLNMGRLNLKVPLLKIQMEYLEQGASNSLLGENVTSIEQFIANKLVDAAYVAIAQAVLTKLNDVTAGAGTPVNTVDITGETSPADALNSSSFPKAAARLYGKFGEDLENLVCFIGPSTSAADIHAIRGDNGAILYPREQGRVMVDGLPLIQSDIVDASVSSGLLSEIVGTQAAAASAHEADTECRLYLAKRNAVAVIIGSSEADLMGGLTVINIDNAGGEGTGAGISVQLSLQVGVMAYTAMPGSFGPGAACLVHHPSAAA